jgi:alkyl hydroperoxide reductase subunit F
VAIDGGLFQQEVEDRQIMAVPSVFLNGAPSATAAWSWARSWPRSTPAPPGARPPSSTSKAPYEVLIIGGGPAGAAAAVYAARKGIRTGIVAERFGGQTMDTLGIENFISVLETEGPKFAAGAGSPGAPLRRGPHHAAARGPDHPAPPSRAAMPPWRWTTARN